MIAPFCGESPLTIHVISSRNPKQTVSLNKHRLTALNPSGQTNTKPFLTLVGDGVLDVPSTFLKSMYKDTRVVRDADPYNENYKLFRILNLVIALLSYNKLYGRALKAEYLTELVFDVSLI